MNMINTERTLVLFKPDVLQRQIVGELISRFEKRGFKIAAMKVVWPSEELVGKHYTDDPEYSKQVGEKAIEGALKSGEKLEETDPVKVGLKIRQWNIDYLSCGPVVAIVFEAPHVVEAVRKIIGSANPLNADIGTVRGDYSPDSFFLSNLQGRTTRNIIHASDSVENAQREIGLWFTKDEIYDYETAMEKVLFDKGWTQH